MSRPRAGSIVIVDWRGGSLPAEPSRLRPAVVVEDSELFPDEYPKLLVVPLTSDLQLAYPTFAVTIEPDPGNGARETSWALAQHVTSVSLRRIQPTASAVTPEQLAALRHRIAIAIGLG